MNSFTDKIKETYGLSTWQIIILFERNLVNWGRFKAQIQFINDCKKVLLPSLLKLKDNF